MIFTTYITKQNRFIHIPARRAVWIVVESQNNDDSQWTAITPKIGCTPDTLPIWLRQHEHR